jgi:hypothetical protein
MSRPWPIALELDPDVVMSPRGADSDPTGPNYFPITAYTFFVELPRDVPVEHNKTVLTLDERGDAWSGFTSEEISAFVGAPEPLPDHIAPDTRLLFRRETVNSALPLQAADQAFSDWIEAILAEDDATLRRDRLETTALLGIDLAKAVVAITRFVPDTVVPDGIETLPDFLGWLQSLFRPGFIHLNNFLGLLGLATEDWQVGPIALSDLSPALPVLFERPRREPVGPRQAGTFLVRAHSGWPDVAWRPAPPATFAEVAAAMQAAAVRNEHPFVEAFLVFRSGWIQAVMGDPNRGVIELGAGIEMLVSTTIRVGGPQVGWDPDRVAEAFAANVGLKKRIREHLGPLLGMTIDLDDDADFCGGWWQTGYQLRNQAVHEGRSIAPEEAVAAKTAAGRMVLGLREAASRDQRLGSVAERLPRSIPEEGFAEWHDLVGFPEPPPPTDEPAETPKRRI